MGRIDPPFVYDRPSRHDFPPTPMGNFNPRAVTQQSWAPARPMPEKNAPLVNFNRHPDSVSDERCAIWNGRSEVNSFFFFFFCVQYAVIPTGRSNVNTMSPRTKGKVKYVRLFQLALRVVTLVGVLGVLFCVICIKDTSMAVAWIIRVAVSLVP